MDEQQGNERDQRNREPRRARAAEHDDQQCGQKEHPETQRREQGVPLVETCDRRRPLRQPGPILSRYGLIFPSAFHKYSVRGLLAVSVNVSTLSGSQSPMLKAWDTIRAPGLSCRVRIGLSFRFDADNK